MSQLITQSIRDYFTDEFKNAISINLDETVVGVSKAIASIIPTALTAIADKSAANDYSSGAIFDHASQAAHYYSTSPDVAQLVNDEAGSNLPTEIFGSNQNLVIRHIAAYSGMKPISVSSLILLVLPVVMGKLGEKLQGENLSRTDFASSLSSSKNSILSMVPDDYELPDLKTPSILAKADNKKIHASALARQANFVIPQWIPVVLIIFVVLLLIYFSRL